ncbi:MAG: efflux transporter outer membrane subunit [Proteobacteria bacterium]|nr:efflux transporter outer membrane subunit [Pseudomonadota bacterium]
MSIGHLLLRANCPLAYASCPAPFSLLFCLISFLSFSGCSHVVEENIHPLVISNSAYTISSSAPEKVGSSQWWLVFNDQLLNEYMQRALAGSFTLQEGYARLKQARSLQKQTDSSMYPSLDGQVSAGSIWDSDGERDDTSGFGVELIWEVDLWGRLSSAAKAAAFEAKAAEDDVQGLALLLSTEVADTYYQLIEQSLYRNLLEQQITANETSLDLIKLRFAHGAASLVDVYQQQELVASVKAQLPLNEARLIILRNRLHVLLGQAPESTSLSLGQSLPQIPSLPQLGVPADLLRNRPDLRQLQRELVAADYRVAAAVADRLPSVKIGSSVGLVSGDVLFSLFADALASIVDWGYKESEVEKQKAVVEEKAARYSQRYLVAIEEVENSLWQERQHELLLAALNEQLIISRATLHESRNRYIQGITDYLPVLAALVSLQNLERTMLQRQRERVSYRLILYRALGGNVLTREQNNIITEN